MTQNRSNDSKVEPTLRRLVVMFDATSTTRQNMTNVSRMFEAIDDSHPQSYKAIDGSVAEDCPIVQSERCNKSMIERAKHDGDDSEANFCAGVLCDSCHQVVVEPELQPVQLVRYIGGVDAEWKKRVKRWLSSQTLGYGLSDKIKKGYVWLCDNYQEGDEVFVFGFSRGAFAARSLVSLLHNCDGVLKKTPRPSTNVDDDKTGDVKKDIDLSFHYKSGDDKEVIDIAYNYYRACVGSPDETNATNANNLAKQKKIFDDYLIESNKSTKDKYTITQLHVPVKMLGVWDTISALGLRVTGYSFIDNLSFSRAQYQFHAQRLPCIVKNAYQALALDDHCEAFKPTLWTSRTSDTDIKQEVKQVWFVGSHSNVGGGADLDDNDDPDDLWQYSYVWMQRQAEKHGLRFFWNYESPATRQAISRPRRVSLRMTEPPSFIWADNKYKQETPWRPTWWPASWPAWWPAWWSAWWSAPLFIREADPKLAMLHWSVIERIQITNEDLAVAKTKHIVKPMARVYRPPTLFPKGSPVMDAKWHIETDHVNPCKQRSIPLSPKGNEKKED